jgi:2-polyprenyl-6-methoxyphenol hydroxylase-like FAD-dependent oxidoreductase
VADLERILIVGGGIAGLTLATALHRQGFTAELVERSPTWHTMGAGIMLHGNGVRILRTLGMSVDVEQAGTNLHSWSFCDQQGELLCEIDLQALWGEVGPSIGITRARLQQVLLAGAAEVPCRLGTALTSLAQDEQRVRVGFSDGSSGDYDLVVGADGLASTVRRLTMDAAPPGYTDLMVWRGLAPHQQTSMQVLLGEGCVFGLVPVGDGQTYGFGIAGSPRLHDPLEGRLERVRRRFAAFGGAVPAYLASLIHDEQLHCAPIEWVELEQWRRRTRGPADDGPGRLYGYGGCLGAGRSPARSRERGERPGQLREPPQTARRLGTAGESCLGGELPPPSCQPQCRRARTGRSGDAGALPAAHPGTVAGGL